MNLAPDSLNCLKIPTIINHQIFLRAYDWSKGISRSNKTNKNKIINNWEDAGNFEKLRFFKIRLCTRILKSSLQGGRAFFFFFLSFILDLEIAQELGLICFCRHICSAKLFEFSSEKLSTYMSLF